MSYNPNNPNGSTTASNSSPVTIATDNNIAKETGGNLASIKADTDKIPSQGQALAAASTPVVLTAAQVTTLTPPTNTGYALDASLTTIDTDIKSNITLHSGSAVVGKVGIDQTTPGTTNLVALGANQSVNESQINGVVPLMGNGTTGTGSQRVTIASDNTAFSVNAIQSTPAAVTAGWPIVNGELADVTGTFTNATQTTSITTSGSLDGYESVTVSINGTYGTATAVFEGSDDSGTTWYALPLARNDSALVEYGYTTLTNTNRMWTGQITGLDQFRVRSTAVASGTANVRISTSSAPTSDSSVVQLGSALPAGSAVIGHVITDAGSVAVASGTTASGSSLSANPLTEGGLAKTANPTAVSDGQVVNALHDKLGKRVVVGSIRDLKANQVTTITSSTAETTIVTAVASTFLDMYGLIVTNTSATAVNVAIKDATSGTTRLNIAVPAGDTRGFMLPESGGIKQSAVNNNWTATSSGSVASLVITALTVQNL